MFEKIEETANYLRKRINSIPTSAIVLGSGLGELVSHIKNPLHIPYAEIPHFPLSTVEGHTGQLIVGILGTKPVIALQGRFHYYEGYDMKNVTFPIRVLAKLGITHLFLSNAAGGLNPSYQLGDLMVISDHINLFPENPLRGKNDNRLGVRFPAMNNAYNATLRKKAFAIAQQAGIPLQQGIYVGTQGPTYETPSEYNLYRILGGDAIGMSTVPEVIVARHAGIDVFAVSIITNTAKASTHESCTHQEVIEAAEKAQPRMTLLFQQIIENLK